MFKVVRRICHLRSMLTIQSATPAETDIVIDILVDAVRWLESRGLPTWSPDGLADTMPNAVRRGEVYLARIDERPVGTVSIQWADPVYWGQRPDNAGYIHKLAIMRAAAGQQIGAQLLAWSEQMIVARDLPFARLDCHAANPFINHFYQAAGYKSRGTVVTNNRLLNLYEKAVLAVNRQDDSR